MHACCLPPECGFCRLACHMSAARRANRLALCTNYLHDEHPFQLHGRSTTRECVPECSSPPLLAFLLALHKSPRATCVPAEALLPFGVACLERLSLCWQGIRCHKLRCLMLHAGKMPALAALAYHRASGRSAAPPSQRLSYAENFLYMLDAGANTDYRPNPRLTRAIDIMFTLHAEHEMNCSTAAARHLASSGVDVYTAIGGAGKVQARCVI